jgi:NADP-dependent 3-hydroxy acid dehydrogenase YdfG
MSTPENKTALVTGASSGIGEAISAELLEDGYRVIGIARDFGKSCLDHEQFLPLSVDLSQLHTLPDRLEKLARDEPNIDSVICCAGSGRFGSLEEFSYAQISALLDLNLTSQIFLARALLPAMKRRGRQWRQTRCRVFRRQVRPARGRAVTAPGMRLQRCTCQPHQPGHGKDRLL